MPEAGMEGARANGVQAREQPAWRFASERQQGAEFSMTEAKRGAARAETSR